MTWQYRGVCIATGQRCMRAQWPTVRRSSGQYREPEPKERMAVAKCGALGWQDCDMRMRSVKKAEAVGCQPSTMTVQKKATSPTAVAWPRPGRRLSLALQSVAGRPVLPSPPRLDPERQIPRPLAQLPCVHEGDGLRGRPVTSSAGG